MYEFCMKILKIFVSFSFTTFSSLAFAFFLLHSSSLCLSCPLQETDFYAWINPMFLDMDTQKDIRQMFCKDSEINLENFLTDEAYKRLSEALKGEGLAWKLTGPPNRQRYEVRRDAQ